MSDQTKPRVWNAGDPEPAGVTIVRDKGGRRWCSTSASAWWYLRDIAGPMYAWGTLAEVAGPLTEVQTSSPVSVPAEDGNASERPNAGDDGDLYAKSTDSVYVYDAVTDTWRPYRRCCADMPTGELPEDAKPLHGEPALLRAAEAHIAYLRGERESEIERAEDAEQRAASWWEAAKRWCRDKRHADWLLSQWKTAAGEQYARADAAEAKLAETEDVAAKTKAHYIRRCENLANVRDRIRGERDEARAKLDQVRAEIAKLDDWHGRRVDLPFVELMRMIVTPEACQ